MCVSAPLNGAPPFSSFILSSCEAAGLILPYLQLLFVEIMLLLETAEAVQNKEFSILSK